MNKNLAIQVTNLKKRYQIGEKEAYLTMREALMNLFLGKRMKKSFWALKGVSFRVKKGEIFGIIGPNGAGKSTVLKLLSRITDPTSGEILIRGKLSSLLELGAGFNSELTGRENIFLNGVILGMKRKEIRQKFKQIVKFSGIAKFIDTPAKYYSNGMFIRLGLAVALQVEFDILVIDEVLSVVDKQFQEQVYEWLKKLKQKGKT
ncbi:ATP-binding cassette domain-containing protein, partial [Microgenomates group bacterium]|nr:ATP-binding cassette domain-containing protein [Microgenomates group bacterium]